MIKSRFSIFFIIILPIISIGLFVLFLSLLKQAVFEISNVSYGFAWLMGAISIYIMLDLIVSSKRMFIQDDQLAVRLVFLNSPENYHLNDILGYAIHVHWTRFGSYKSFHFKTSDLKVYSFHQREYANYDELVQKISSDKPCLPINQYHNWKALAKLLVISIVSSNLISILVLAIERG